MRNFEGLHAIGSKVQLDIRRDGTPLRLTATLKEQPRALDGASLDPRLSGAGFSELPERLRQAGVSGVLVESVAQGSRAAASGMREGDVVMASSAGAFEDLAGFRAGFTRPPAQLVLQIVRGNQRGVLQMQ
ncbi:HtrA protease/chaperone protein [Lysobacter sp. A03]|nr:HtrA protease/chaperone protein [Lysobacter sp. A03]